MTTTDASLEATTVSEMTEIHRNHSSKTTTRTRTDAIIAVVSPLNILSISRETTTSSPHGTDPVLDLNLGPDQGILVDLMLGESMEKTVRDSLCIILTRENTLVTTVVREDTVGAQVAEDGWRTTTRDQDVEVVEGALNE